jgi:hypothetical protein
MQPVLASREVPSGRHGSAARLRYNAMVARSGPAPNRRRFVSLGAATLFGGASVLVSACDGSEPPAGPEPPADRVGTISLNHGHVAVVTAAQLDAGGALKLEIQGSSIHGHALELSADEVARIRRGEIVSVLSAAGWEDKHDHRVTFNA